MHGADVWDQIRKEFGIDLVHRTGKWTIRIMEICWSLIITQAYNIYRYNNKNTQRELNAHQFKLAVILGMMNLPIVAGPRSPEPIRQTAHVILQWPVGSRYPGRRNDTRRFQSVCRHCPDRNPDGSRNACRMTTYYCVCCKVGIHPLCFEEFHKDKPEHYRPKKPLRIRENGTPASDEDD